MLDTKTWFTVPAPVTDRPAKGDVSVEDVADHIIECGKRYAVVAFQNNIGRLPLPGDEPVYRALLAALVEGVRDYYLASHDLDEAEAWAVWLARRRPGSPAAMALN